MLLCWGHLTNKIADFLHNEHSFLIAPRDLHYFGASPQDGLAFVAARQNGVFSLRIAHSRAFFSFQEKKFLFLWHQRM